MALTYAYGVTAGAIDCHDDESFYYDVNRASATLKVADLLELVEVLEGRHDPEEIITLNFAVEREKETADE